MPDRRTEFLVNDISAGQDHYFFQTALATHSDGTFPDDREAFASQTLSVEVPAFSDTFTYVFDASGVTGTWSLVNAQIGGTFSMYSHNPDPYGCDSRILMNDINFDYFRFRLGADSENATEITGRVSGFLSTNQFFLGGSNSGIGNFALTK